MSITYSFDAQQGLINTVVAGEVCLADIEAHFRQVSAEPWFPAPAIADAREAPPTIPSREVRAIVELLRQLGPRLHGAPTAVLVASDVAFGLVRMIELLLDDVVTIRPFRDRAAAFAWLAEQRHQQGRPPV
jgi:hypothetical protein